MGKPYPIRLKPEELTFVVGNARTTIFNSPKTTRRVRFEVCQSFLGRSDQLVCSPQTLKSKVPASSFLFYPARTQALQFEIHIVLLLRAPYLATT